MREDVMIPEIVGSKDLRETFKEKGRVAGSFSINGRELHNFEANSIEALLAGINARSNETFVDASIDDGYHLVLEAQSPGPITIRGGAPYVAAPSATSGQNTADEVINKLKQAAENTGKKDEDKGNTILDDLGLEETKQEGENAGPQGYFTAVQPGLTKEQREYQRYQRAVERGAIRGMPQEIERNKYDGPRRVPQGGGFVDENQKRFNPIPGDPPPASYVPNPDTQRNNPIFQKAPVVNSDHQPTYTDSEGTGAPGPAKSDPLFKQPA